MRGPLVHRTDQAVFHHPGLEKRPDEFEHPFVGHPRGHPRHQAVVIDPIEEFFEIKVNHNAVALGNVLLRLGYGLMGGASRSEAVTVLENVGSQRFCRTCSKACWISLSTTHGTPSFLTPPSGLGISTRLTGCGR